MHKKYKHLFSIITCTRDSGKFIQRNINSVKDQTFDDYEHIFVDGKSKDETLFTIRKYISMTGKKNKLFLQEPAGISAAFNKGIECATGEYLFFLNSDDWFYDNKVLEDAANFLRDNVTLDWIYGIINVVKVNGKGVGIFPKYEIFKHRFPLSA